MAADGDCWIFGYGSLVWRPAFGHAERRPGILEGWSRRFWQASTDHRGVPGAPGRVVTLVRRPDAVCWGALFRLAPGAAAAVLRTLDERESGGFERLTVSVRLPGSRAGAVRAIAYVAGEGNPNYLGPAPLAEMAAQIRRARGPSGTNTEYVVRLAEALRAMEARDAHVFALARLLEGA